MGSKNSQPIQKGISSFLLMQKTRTEIVSKIYSIHASQQYMYMDAKYNSRIQIIERRITYNYLIYDDMIPK